MHSSHSYYGVAFSISTPLTRTHVKLLGLVLPKGYFAIFEVTYERKRFIIVLYKESGKFYVTQRVVRKRSRLVSTAISHRYTLSYRLFVPDMGVGCLRLLESNGIPEPLVQVSDHKQPHAFFFYTTLQPFFTEAGERIISLYYEILLLNAGSIAMDNAGNGPNQFL